MGAKKFLSTKQTALLLGVSVSTVQNLVEQGLLRAWKTAGGHRRIYEESIDSFRQSFGYENNLMGPEEPMQSQVERSTARPVKAEVLIIEDDPFMHQVYMKALTNYDDVINVHVCEDGLSGLMHIGTQKPDLLILDLNIPNVDGFEMLKSIRSAKQTSSLQVLVVSGLSDEELQAQQELLRPYKFVRKPISADFLEGYFSCFVASRKLII